MQNDDRDAIRTVVARSGRLLDDGRFPEYVDLFAADGRYSLEAHARK